MIFAPIAVAFGVVALSLFSAGAASAQSSAQTVFSLDFRALGRHAAWYVALEKGYYKQAGLEVTIVPSQGTAQAIQTVEAGTAQFAFSDVAGLVAARANSNAQAKMVAVIYQKAPYAIFSLSSGANVTQPKQLEGLEIASGAGSFTQKVIEAFMVDKGLNASSVKFVNIDPAARVSMLVSKRVPAIETFVMSQPAVEKAAGPNQAQTFLLAAHGLTLYSNGILVRPDYLQANPERVKGFVQASLQGWRDAIKDPSAAADIIMKHVKGLDRDVVLAELKIVTDLVLTPETRERGLGLLDPAAMKASVDFVVKATGGGDKVKAEDLFDTGALTTVKP